MRASLLMLLVVLAVVAQGDVDGDRWARDFGNLIVEHELELLSLSVQDAPGGLVRLRCSLLGDWSRYLALRGQMRVHSSAPQIDHELIERTETGALRADLVLVLRLPEGSR